MSTYTSKVRTYREARGLLKEQLAVFFETTVEEIFPPADIESDMSR